MKYLLFFLILYKYFSKTHGSIYLFYLNNNIYLICYYYFIIVYCPLSICLFPLIWFFSVSALHSLQKFPTSSSFSHGQITSPPQAPICMFRWIKFTTMLSLSLSLSLSLCWFVRVGVFVYLCVDLSVWVCLCLWVSCSIIQGLVWMQAWANKLYFVLSNIIKKLYQI